MKPLKLLNGMEFPKTIIVNGHGGNNERALKNWQRIEKGSGCQCRGLDLVQSDLNQRSWTTSC